MEYSRLITALEQSLDELTFSDYPALLGQLERIKALVWARAVPVFQVTERLRVENGNKLLTIQEVADQLSIPKSRAYELARQGRLPIIRIGKYLRISQTVLREWVEKQKT